ncbi:MAG: tryptophan-rich sensory protein [Candidatus Methanoperedens sp.]|nr:tryptophan-rich sensory protein [Candidatus Methanoperedens sp.]CAG0981434.1 Tryptophan-rich protein TspO [Methanosarcinales archaeon]
MKPMKTFDILRLITSIVICLTAGALGSFFTTPAISTWYATLIKPSIAPPNWVFFPVWTALFIMMGISLFLVWKKGFQDHQVKAALSVFAIQLILNILWSAAFFGLRSPLAGLIEIVILWIVILVMILKFMRISKVAGLLLIPYILWVTFAAMINFLIWSLNR